MPAVINPLARVEAWNSGWYLVMAVFIFLAFVLAPFVRVWAHHLTYPWRADRVHVHHLGPPHRGKTR